METRWLRCWMDPRLLCESLRLIDGWGVRILHSHLHGANLWGGALRRLRRGLRHVSHVHRMDVPAVSLDGILNRLWVSRSDVVVAVSDSVRDELVGRHGMPGDRVVTVYNGVDLERHHPPARGEREEARRRLGLQEGDAVVGIVARLRPEKDHETFLRAAAGVAARERRAIFLVAGDGTPGRAKQLEALSHDLGVGERVRFMGLRGDVREILLSLDVAVLCSRTEAMPLAVLEYLASGLPVVCTAVGGLPEVLGLPPCGILVPPADPEALAGAILGLLRDPAGRRALSVAARSRAEQEFDVRRSVARLESVYERILGGSQRAGDGR